MDPCAGDVDFIMESTVAEYADFVSNAAKDRRYNQSQLAKIPTDD